MNPSERLFQNFRKMPASARPNRAFTLAELLVVILTLAALAMVVLPALAGVQNKGGRMQCAANLRRIYVASMIYASHYRGWLPINTVHTGSANINKLNGMQYTYFVTTPGLLASKTFVSTNAPASDFSDLGHVYNAGLAGNGQMFYCPDQWGSVLGANNYLPLLTTDVSGYVRSSYAFNPRTLDPTNANFLRAYQKTGDLPPHKLLAVDYFGGGGGTGFSPNPGFTPHFRDGAGWNVLFTDGSVQFSRNIQAGSLIQNFQVNETVQSQEMEYQILNFLELDH